MLVFLFLWELWAYTRSWKPWLPPLLMTRNIRFPGCDCSQIRFLEKVTSEWQRYSLRSFQSCVSLTGLLFLQLYYDQALQTAGCVDPNVLVETKLRLASSHSKIGEKVSASKIVCVGHGDIWDFV